MMMMIMMMMMERQGSFHPHDKYHTDIMPTTHASLLPKSKVHCYDTEIDCQSEKHWAWGTNHFTGGHINIRAKLEHACNG